jgi:Flp pilus assembly protein TadD
MLVTLPFVLLLLDYWPLQRWPGKNLLPEEKDIGGPSPPGPKRSVSFLLCEKIPLLFLTGSSIIFTLWSARAGGALVGGDTLPFTTRLANALVSYGTYPVKMLWPFDLSVIYPYPEVIAPGKMIASAFFLSAMTAVAVFRAKRLPYLVTGWFWYLGTLLPVSGLVQVGSQSMADRYAYVPLLGIFIMIAWGLADFAGKGLKDGAVRTLLPVLLLMALAVRTWFQIPCWQNSSTLFSHAVEVTRGNYIAHYHLGTSLLGEGKKDEAIGHFRKAAQIKPNYEPAYNSIGVALQLEGRFPEALISYRMALAIKPDYGEAFYNMGTLFEAMGNLDEAVIAYRQAVKWNPKSAPLYNNLGVALVKKGNPEEAIAAYRQALLLNPEYAGAHYNLALTLRNKGLAAEAEAHFREAARLTSIFRPAGMTPRRLPGGEK